MRIPQDKIEEVRNATDIVELIGVYIKLRKRGKSYVGLCPFHSEKTPSFNVSPDRQMYHCFGCGVGGNAITFVMEYEKVSFMEAVRSLAEKAGIPLPTQTVDDQARASEQEELYNVCREAARFYHKCLTETAEGKFALDYFRNRGFKDETIRTFGLGYSPRQWDALLKHAEANKLPTELLEKAGLIRRRDDGTCFDYFRGRAMFPIFSTTGRIVGFGARKLHEDDQLGKYINSPETLVYNKSRILYGIFQAKEAVREKDFVILVEGYADLISVHQAGVRNIVASSGTALTPEQVQLISRYTKNVTIMYDADSAGSQATLRGVDLLLENDLDVRVAALPHDEDPDSFVRKEGRERLQTLLDDAVSFVDFIAQAFERDGKLDTPEGQAQTVRAIVQTIAKMKDELKRNFYIKQTAEKYHLYESTLRREFEALSRAKRHYGQGDIEPGLTTQDVVFVRGEPTSSMTTSTAEQELLRAILTGGKEIARMILSHVTTEYFADEKARWLYEYLTRAINENRSVEPSSLIDEIEDPSCRDFITNLVFNKYPVSYEGIKGVIRQADPSVSIPRTISKLKYEILKGVILENQKEMRLAGSRGEDIFPYVQRHTRLREELSELASDFMN